MSNRIRRTLRSRGCPAVRGVQGFTHGCFKAQVLQGQSVWGWAHASLQCTVPVLSLRDVKPEGDKAGSPPSCCKLFLPALPTLLRSPASCQQGQEHPPPVKIPATPSNPSSSQTQSATFHLSRACCRKKARSEQGQRNRHRARVPCMVHKLRLGSLSHTGRHSVPKQPEQRSAQTPPRPPLGYHGQRPRSGRRWHRGPSLVHINSTGRRSGTHARGCAQFAYGTAVSVETARGLCCVMPPSRSNLVGAWPTPHAMKSMWWLWVVRGCEVGKLRQHTGDGPQPMLGAAQVPRH